jgi:hypothetical protein
MVGRVCAILARVRKQADRGLLEKTEERRLPDSWAIILGVIWTIGGDRRKSKPIFSLLTPADVVLASAVGNSLFDIRNFKWLWPGLRAPGHEPHSWSGGG